MDPTLRRIGIALMLGTAAVAVIATQWPFDYHLTQFGVERRWSRVDWSWFRRTRSGAIRFDRDFVLNLMMLVPLGVGFAMWRRASAVRVILEGLALGFATSILLELAQLATRHRYTTFQDVWRNALGCMVGAALVTWLARPVAPRE